MCVFRVKKLKETLVTVQQLDKNMSNLRSWLSHTEAELSRPITYSVCHHQEIQRRLAEQQVNTNTHNHTYQFTLVCFYCLFVCLRLIFSFSLFCFFEFKFSFSFVIFF